MTHQKHAIIFNRTRLRSKCRANAVYIETGDCHSVCECIRTMPRCTSSRTSMHRQYIAVTYSLFDEQTARVYNHACKDAIK